MTGAAEKPRIVSPLAFGWPASSFWAWATNSLGHLGGPLARLVVGHRVQRRHARLLRIGVGHVAAEPLAAEDDHEAVLLDRLDEHLDAGNLHLAELDGQRAALFAGDAAGAAVGDVAGGVERAEVAADGHVLRPQLEADAGGLQRPAADQVLDRIVAEQAQVAGSAAGGDARRDRDTCSPGRRAGPGRRGWGSWRPPVRSVRPARSAARPARRPPASRFSTCSRSSVRGRVVEYPCSGSFAFDSWAAYSLYVSKRRRWREGGEGATRK